MKITHIENPSRDRIRQFIHASRAFPAMGDFELQSDSEGTFAVVHHDSEKLVAGAFGLIAKDWAYIETVWVDASYRGQGIGRRLMQAVEAYVCQVGLNGIFLSTVDFQAPDFYPKLGYTELGKLPDRPKGYNATFFSKIALDADGLTDEFAIENPITETTFDVLEEGLTHYSEQYAPLVTDEWLIELHDTDGNLSGGLFGHVFWGYINVHLLYAHDDSGVHSLLDALHQQCRSNHIGVMTHAFTDSHKAMLAEFAYKKFASLPDRPTGTVCEIWVLPQL